MITISEIVAKTEATKLMFCDSFQPQQKPPLHNQLLALQWWLFVRTFEVVSKRQTIPRINTASREKYPCWPNQIKRKPCKNPEPPTEADRLHPHRP